MNSLSFFLFQLSEQDVNAAAAMLSSYCIGGVDTKEFFDFFDLPDTFRSWFLVSELHIYMICNRLLVGQTYDGNRIKIAVVKSLWEDCLERVKLLADIPGKKKREYMMDVEYESLFIRELMKMASLASQFQSYNKIRQISMHFNNVINR